MQCRLPCEAHCNVVQALVVHFARLPPHSNSHKSPQQFDHDDQPHLQLDDDYDERHSQGDSDLTLERGFSKRNGFFQMNQRQVK